MLAVFDDLRKLYADKGVPYSPLYEEIVGDELGGPLAYATPLMYGTAETVFSSRVMVAFNLLQNCIDEAKGAARISIVAAQADGDLLAMMRRHVAEEMKHSRQFLKLIDITGFGHELAGSVDEVNKVLDFEDELGAFMCRVHSIEVRSWTMLRIYIDILDSHGDAALRAALPVLHEIIRDEIGHVLYTGRYVSERLAADPSFSDTLVECLRHTNRETWNDLAAMTQYLAENYRAALAPV